MGSGFHEKYLVSLECSLLIERSTLGLTLILQRIHLLASLNFLDWQSSITLCRPRIWAADNHKFFIKIYSHISCSIILQHVDLHPPMLLIYATADTLSPIILMWPILYSLKSVYSLYKCSYIIPFFSAFILLFSFQTSDEYWIMVGY